MQGTGGEQTGRRQEIVIERKYSDDQKAWLSNPDVQRFADACAGWGLALDERKLLQFALFTDLLLSWNRVINLTAITALSEILEKHYLDSLSLVKVLPPESARGKTLIDLGTGAGFPGIPLAILLPDCFFTLADAQQKRVSFLDEVIGVLGLRNVRALHGRAEDMGHDPSHRERYDVCCARAVAELRVLAEYGLPLTKTGGYFIPYKGDVAEELPAAAHAIKTLGGEVEKEVNFSLGEEAAHRTLLLIRKKTGTPRHYPRRAGLPTKEPL